MAEVKYLNENGLSTVWSKVKGIVTPKADKVSGATAGHLAGLNSSGNLTDSGLPATNVAQKDGSYSGMTVGAAEDLVSAESVASEFTSRITGGSTAVGKGGTALLDKIKGRTLVWNQRVAPDAEYAGTLTTKDTSVTTENKYVETTTTASSGRSLSFNSGADIAPGHKALVIWIIKSDYASAPYLRYTKTPNVYSNINISNYVADAWNVVYSIIEEGIMFVGNTGIIPSGANHIQGKYLSTPLSGGLKVFDLTLMFGAGNEPTIEEFKALFPEYDYTYNDGELVNNAASGIETVGWNIWDEEWENGLWSTNGTKSQQGTANIRCANKISVIPGATYYIYTASRYGSGLLVGVFYKDGSYTRYTVDTNHSWVAPANAESIVFCSTNSANVGTYNNDICINLSDPSRNGTYEPYWRSELELGLGDIKVKSHNLWDEVWEEGTIDIDTGQNITGTAIRSVNYIPVSPGGTYYNKGTAGIREYDAQKNYLGRQSQLTDVAFTVSNNCSYIRIISAGVTTYSNNICINLSDPAFNGRYEPYGDGGVITITGGLKSAGTAYDEISGGKLVKRIGEVDMGNVDYSYSEQSSHSRFGVPVSNLAPSAWAVCSRYLVSTAHNTGYNGDDLIVTSGVDASGARIWIWDDSYTDAATLKASLSGQWLYYQLATPIEYELAEAIPTAMRNDPYGTERRLPADTAGTVLAPFRADITYSTNIKEAVQSMHQNFINVNSMQDFLAELGAQMGGTWTMRPADGKFDFTFTPNPVEPTL